MALRVECFEGLHGLVVAWPLARREEGGECFAVLACTDEGLRALEDGGVVEACLRGRRLRPVLGDGVTALVKHPQN